MPPQVGNDDPETACGEPARIRFELAAAGGEPMHHQERFAVLRAKNPICDFEPAARDELKRRIAGFLFAGHALPIRTPAAKTNSPPATTCNAARKNGVDM